MQNRKPSKNIDNSVEYEYIKLRLTNQDDSEGNVKTFLISVLFIIILALFIVFPACEKSEKNITSPIEQEQFVCGDANGDGAPNIMDISYMISYLFKTGPTPNLAAADIDGIYGLSYNDVLILVNYIYEGGSDPNCLLITHDTTLPVSSDSVLFSTEVVPPGDSIYQLDIILKTHNNIQGFTLPLKYSCESSTIICDSLIGYWSRYDFPQKTFLYNCISDTLRRYGIDTVNQKALVCSRGAFPAGFSGTVASLWFTVTPSVDTQTIVIDTTTYPPSHIVIFTHYEPPETIASVPTIIF